MASLTETTHIMKGHTVLFVPNEDLSDVEHAAKQKVFLAAGRFLRPLSVGSGGGAVGSPIRGPLLAAAAHSRRKYHVGGDLRRI